jgi:hypothetical protein
VKKSMILLFLSAIFIGTVAATWYKPTNSYEANNAYRPTNATLPLNLYGPSAGEWILLSGIWNDSGVWDDTATWNDGV